MYFHFSDEKSRRLVKNAEVELVIKLRHPTSIGNTLVIQPFLTHCSRRSSYFSNLRWCTQSKFSSKGTVNSITKTFFNLTDQMTISGRWVFNAISIGNTKWCSKSVENVPVRAAIEEWYVHIFTRKFWNIYFFNEMNRSIGDII